MASSKEIRTKIKSVQGTRKITKAMEMVAASKMRRAPNPTTSPLISLMGHSNRRWNRSIGPRLP